MRYLLTALGMLLVGIAQVPAATPLYVGENLAKENLFIFNFLDVPTRADLTRSEGNIAALKLEMQRSWMETGALSVNLPIYTATASATGRKRDTNFGNLAIGLGITQRISDISALDWGYIVRGRFYAPTARQPEADSVAYGDPTVNFYQFFPFQTAFNPQAGFYVHNPAWAIRSTLGYGIQYISKNSYAQKINYRNSMTWQTAATWHLSDFFDLNAEYNGIYLDTRTAAGRGRYRHAATPSAVFRFAPVTANVYLTIPVDNPTRDITAVAIGATAGFVF